MTSLEHYIMNIWKMKALSNLETWHKSIKKYSLCQGSQFYGMIQQINNHVSKKKLRTNSSISVMYLLNMQLCFKMQWGRKKCINLILMFVGKGARPEPPVL